MKYSENRTAGSHVQYNPDTLLLHESVSLSVKNRSTLPHHLIRLLLSLFGLIGSFWCFDGFFRPGWNLKVIVLFLIGFACLTRLLYRLPRFGTLCLLGEAAAVCLVLLRYMEQAAEGAYTVFRIMSQTITKQPVVNTIPAASPGGWSRRSMLMLTALTTAALLTVIVEYAENSRFCFVLRFLVTFMFLETGLYFGLETHPLAVLMLIAFWAGSLVISISAETERRLGKQKRAPAGQKVISVSAGSPRAATDSALVLLLAVTAAVGAAVGIGTHRYVRSERLNQYRERIMDSYRNMTIHDFTGWLSKIDLGEGPNVISDEIDLKHNNDLHFDGRTVLELEVDSAVRKDYYYLRGMARKDYTGEGWAVRSGSYRRIRSLLKDLAAANRMPQTIWHSGHTGELMNSDGKYAAVSWKLRAKKSEERNYLPYQALVPDGAEYSYDSEISLRSKQNYSFATINNAAVDWAELSAGEAPSGDPQVSEYEQFVDEEYLTVPDTAAMRRIYAAFLNQYQTDGAALYDKLLMIRSFIWDRAVYDTAPGDFPDDRDLAEYFLLEGHRGYCAHYATAAVLLCRMCGIPARYVQGYVVAEDDFVLKNKNGSYAVAVPDHRAHAWAEIYVKGYGWMPYEFTEGITAQWRDTAPQQTEPQQTSTAASVSTTVPTQTLPTGTTEPTVTTAPGSGKGTALPAWLGTLLKVLGIVLVCTVLIGGILLLWRAHHFRTVHRRREAMRQKDPVLAGSASCAFLLRLLRMQGIRRGNALHGMFAETAEEACDLLEAGTLTRAIGIQQQAVFSKDGISDEEAAELCGIAEKLADAMYAGADRRHRLILRWFRHIVR